MCLAVPGKIVSVREEGSFLRSGRVEFGGVAREVNLACVPEAGVGDYVIVHVGMAISKLDEEEASRIFSYLREMNELGELKDESS